MAKSKANKDKEENSGSNAPQDDDDFGLPELEYEALDDEDDSDEEETGDTANEEPVAETTPEPPLAKEEEPVEEKQAEYTEPTYSEPAEETKVSSIFDLEESGQEEISNVFSGGGASTVETKKSIYENEEGGEAKSFTRIIIIGAVSFVLIGFGFLYWHHKDDGKKPVAQPQPKEQKAEPVPVKEPEPVQQTAVKEPVRTGPAEVVTLTERTGRSYVIVGSFFDGDLAADFGNELAAKGISATIIKPFGKSRFYRVSIADYGNYSEAMNEAEKAKSSYGGEVWALKY